MYLTVHTTDHGFEPFESLLHALECLWRGNSVPPVQASWKLLSCSFENVTATGFKKEKYVDGGDLVFFSL